MMTNEQINALKYLRAHAFARRGQHKEAAESARAVEPAVVWSGATPREKLDQWCRERGNPKPQYEVASKNTFVKLAKPFWAETLALAKKSTFTAEMRKTEPVATAP